MGSIIDHIHAYKTYDYCKILSILEHKENYFYENSMKKW
jgi:aspartate carbamoyltransferase regulatory subunit